MIILHLGSHYVKIGFLTHQCILYICSHTYGLYMDHIFQYDGIILSLSAQEFFFVYMLFIFTNQQKQKKKYKTLLQLYIDNHLV